MMAGYAEAFGWESFKTVANRDNSHLAGGRLAGIPWGTWRTVRFARRYRNPVVVASLVDAPATKGPAFVVRVRNLTIGEATLNVGSSNLKSVRRSRRKALAALKK